MTAIRRPARNVTLSPFDAPQSLPLSDSAAAGGRMAATGPDIPRAFFVLVEVARVVHNAKPKRDDEEE